MLSAGARHKEGPRRDISVAGPLKKQENRKIWRATRLLMESDTYLALGLNASSS